MSDHTTKKNVHEKHRKRVRENVLKNGFKQLEDHQLLELLLFYSLPRGDTNELAHDLINEFDKSLASVFNATPSELMRVKGVGENSAIQLAAISELCDRIIKAAPPKRKTFKSNQDIISLIKKQFINVNTEKMLLLCFDSAMRAKSIDFIAEGDSARLTSELKNIVSKILEHDPVFVIIAHNHPQGSALPSGADIDATASLSVLLRKLDIVLSDHIIVNPNSYYSMREDERYSGIFG